MSDFDELVAGARADGWASAAIEARDVRLAAQLLGWTEIAIRIGDPTVKALKPVDIEKAHPSSMSAVVGLGAQPLHTDGAHLRRRPEFVALISDKTSTTPTMLCRPSSSDLHDAWVDAREALWNGVFAVRSGAHTFLSTALDSTGIRYDPTCMAPMDRRAKEAASLFSELLECATAFHWSKPRQVLLIDNRRALHARAAVADTDLDREILRVAFTTGAAA